MLQWNGSEVMEGFAKIAADSGLITSDLGDQKLGNPDKETPVKGHRRYEPTEEYNVTKETGDDLIHKAHPKDAEPAKAAGEGGLVENLIQQQEKDIEVAIRMPSGALTGKHAEIIQTLTKLANQLDEAGESEAADRIDQTIGRISGLPFDGSLRKEAFWGALFAPLFRTLLWGGAGLGAAYALGPAMLSKLTSTRDTLSEDIKDVIEIASTVGSDDPTTSKLAADLKTILSPYVIQFSKPLPSPKDNRGIAEYIAVMSHFSQDLPDIQRLANAMSSAKGGVLEFLKLGPKSRLQEKMKDMMETFQDTQRAAETISGAVQAVKAKEPPPAAAKLETGQTNIAELQDIIREQGFDVPKTGTLDNATKDAIKKLEIELEKGIRKDPSKAEALDRRGWTLKNSILKEDGKLIDNASLRRLINLATGK